VKAIVAGDVVGGVVVVVVAGVVGVELGVTTAAAVVMIGFVTVDEQPAAVVHGPVVMVAVFVMLPVALDATVAEKVTVALSPAARLTVKVQVLPLGLITEQVSGVVTAQAGVPLTVRDDGTASVTVADPAPSPTFLTATVYAIVDPGATEVPDVGTSVLTTVKFGAVTEKHSLA
jgi:hypothetical protein